MTSREDRWARREDQQMALRALQLRTARPLSTLIPGDQTMSEERRRLIDLKIRSTRGRALQRDWLAGLSKLTRSIQSENILLPLQLTDQLKTVLVDRMRRPDVRHEEWPVSADRAVVARLQAIGQAVGPVDLVLFSNVDEYLGAARVRADLVLADPFTVWAFTGDDLVLVTDDMAQGLCLERNFYSYSGKYVSGGVFQLATWGTFTM